jgi:hypothetical protein
MTSNAIHEATISKSKYTIALEVAELSILPDLATQIQSYIDLPPPTQRPTETIFVLSFGFWDIYDFSRIDYPIGQNGTDNSIKEIFKQLDVLYDHFTTKLYSPGTSVNATDEQIGTSAFRIIMPKVFDPTLLPGWLTQRPAPPSPNSVAEQQKNAVYLTERWNNMMENQIAQWLVTQPATTREKFEQGPSHEDARESDKHLQTANKPRIVEKDVFYYDLPKLLLDIIIEHQLEDEGLSDASGLGTGESPFESVYKPCMREDEGDDTDGLVDLNGMLVCKEPEEYLFWDSFHLGAVVKEMIGKEIGEMVRGNKTLRNQWGH